MKASLLPSILIAVLMNTICKAENCKIRDQQNGYSYTVCQPKSGANFTVANNSCVSEGGDLVSILSKEENEFVKQLLLNMSSVQGNSWIGLKFGESEWTDGSNRTNVSEQEDEMNCSAAVINVTSEYLQWQFEACHEIQPVFICKIMLQTTEEPTTTPTSTTTNSTVTTGRTDSDVSDHTAQINSTENPITTTTIEANTTTTNSSSSGLSTDSKSAGGLSPLTMGVVICVVAVVTVILSLGLVRYLRTRKRSRMRNLVSNIEVDEMDDHTFSELYTSEEFYDN